MRQARESNSERFMGILSEDKTRAEATTVARSVNVDSVDIMNGFKIGIVALVGFLSLASCTAQNRVPKPAASATTAPSLSPAAKSDEVNVLAIADWGANNDRQRRVAEAIKQYVKRSGVAFSGVLCGGDNIYVKLTGTADPMWQQVFETMYDPAVINFPFYVVAGNHDYQNGKSLIELNYAKENPSSRWKYPSPYYKLELPQGAATPLVTVYMLDSNRDALGKDGWNEETAWLQGELAKPRAAGTWRVAVAHHPLFSNGEHGDIGVLQTTWGRLFKDYGLDLYLGGHDHDMQHLEVEGWPMSFLLVGGGGAGVRPMVVDRRGPFSKSMNGFAHLQFTPQHIVVRLLDQQGEPVHTFERDHDGQVQVLQTTPSDVGKPRTAKTINRPDLATQPATQPATQSSD